MTTTRTSEALADKLEKVQREADSLKNELKTVNANKNEAIERAVESNERVARLQSENNRQKKLMEKRYNLISCSVTSIASKKEQGQSDDRGGFRRTKR